MRGRQKVKTNHFLALSTPIPPAVYRPEMLEVGKTTMVVSVPRELSSDHSAVLLLAEASGRITEADISGKLRWEGGRPRRVLDELMQVKTMVWSLKSISLSCYYLYSLRAFLCVCRLTFLSRCCLVSTTAPMHVPSTQGCTFGRPATLAST